ncbi:MAG TPA: hypothetical protein VLA66_05815, partial [Thermoanaerobaculia bacterium]|nr:hypothetical protein [Thermoanaerobaculia bacterium]
RSGAARPVDGHRPERFELAPFEPPPPPRFASAPPSRPRGLLAMRTVRPALELEVQVDARGTPRELGTLASDAAARRTEIRGGVVVAAGPWRIEEGWWSESAVEREYWDVELAGAGLWRIYRDPGSGRWWADGAYD